MTNEWQKNLYKSTWIKVHLIEQTMPKHMHQSMPKANAPKPQLPKHDKNMHKGMLETHAPKPVSMTKACQKHINQSLSLWPKLDNNMHKTCLYDQSLPKTLEQKCAKSACSKACLYD